MTLFFFITPTISPQSGDCPKIPGQSESPVGDKHELWITMLTSNQVLVWCTWFINADHSQSLLPPLISWRESTFKSVAIFTSISREGCILLEHHRETVASFFPTCSASHFPVLPFSTNTTFSLLIFWDSIRLDLPVNYNTSILNLSHCFSEKWIEHLKSQV